MNLNHTIENPDTMASETEFKVLTVNLGLLRLRVLGIKEVCIDSLHRWV